MASRMAGRAMEAVLWQRGLQLGAIRVWVQLAQAGRHGQVGRATDPIGGQELEGTSRRSLR